VRFLLRLSLKPGLQRRAIATVTFEDERASFLYRCVLVALPRKFDEWAAIVWLHFVSAVSWAQCVTHTHALPLLTACRCMDVYVFRAAAQSFLVVNVFFVSAMRAPVITTLRCLQHSTGCCCWLLLLCARLPASLLCRGGGRSAFMFLCYEKILHLVARLIAGGGASA
jgi:hypothetical protein